MSFIERLFPGISLEEFRKSYWLYKPLSVIASLERFPEIVDNPIFASVSTALGMKCGELRIDMPNQDGKNLVLHYPNASLDKSRDALHRGQTIYMGGIAEQPLPQFAEQITAELDLPIFLEDLVERFWIAFAARPSRGLRWHWDRHHLIMLQVIGKKRFRIAQNQFFQRPSVPPWGYDCWRKGMHPRLMGALDVARLEDHDLPSECVELELSAGHALFMPAGLWHSAETIEDSFHLAYAVKVPTLPEFLIAQFDVMHEAYAARFNVPVASNEDVRALGSDQDWNQQPLQSATREWFLAMSKTMEKYAQKEQFSRFLKKMIADVERGTFSADEKEMPDTFRKA